MNTSPRPAHRHVFWCFCLGLFLVCAANAADPTFWVYPVFPSWAPAIPNEYLPGSTVALELQSALSPSATLQWLHEDQPIPAATSRKLTLTNLTAADAGNYRVRATDGSSVIHSNTVVVNVLPAGVSPVDRSFVSRLPADFKVASVGPFAADGSFIAISSDSTKLPVRLAADGSIVTGFNYPVTAGPILASFPDGRLLTARSPYLLDAHGSPLTFNLPAAFDSSAPLSGAVVAPDGKFLLSQGTTIVRLLADGTVDPAFSFSTADASATAYAVDAQGRAFVSVRRNAPSPYNYPPSWTVIYRLTASGSKDPAFAEKTSIMTYYTWFKVVPLADGRIFYWSAYHGYRAWYIFNADGSPDPSWSGNVFTERDLVVDPVRSDVYLIPSSGALRRYHLGANALIEDTAFFGGATAAAYSSFTFAVTPDSKLLLLTNSDSWEGHATQNLARLNPDAAHPLLPPSLSISGATTPIRGATITLNAVTSDAGPYTYQWLALDGQPLPANTVSSSLVLANISTANFGRYQVRVNGAFGTVLSGVVELQLGASNLPYLANLSGRAVPGTGEDTTFAGLTTKIYAGALGVPLLFRGVGPGLKNLGVANYLPNPALNLRNLAGTVVANNDNWGDSADRDKLRAAAATTGAFALAETSLDAALLKTAYDQQFTVQLSDQSNASGVGLLEIYRVPDDLVAGELTNLSLRARTAPGEATAIAGFVIADPQNFDRSARVLLRVVGPTLSTQGIQHPLADPVLTLYNSKGEVVAQNDNWSATNPSGDSATLSAAMSQVGAFNLPANSKDAALLLDLPAGAYSMHATGGSGVVLLEIYLVR